MIEAFINHITHELQLSPRSIEAYRSDLLQWQDYATSGGRHELMPLTTTASDLRTWVNHLARTNVSPRTIRRKIQSLRAFFRFLASHHGLKENPALSITLPKIAQELPVYVKPSETSAMLREIHAAEEAPEPTNSTDEATIIKQFEAARNALIIEVLYCTGLRCSELIDLPDTWVDTERGELKVRGKRNKDRIVPFGPELSEMMNHYRQLRTAAVCKYPPTFFCRADSRPLYRKMVYNIVHNAMEGTVNASRRSPHVLRHTFATDMLNGGADLTSVQQLLGHQSLAATQVYTHISYRDLKQNYQLAHPRAQKKED